MALIAWEELAHRVNDDGEFHIASRFGDTTLRIDIAAESQRRCFQDGELREIGSCDSDAQCELHLSAPLEDPEQFLRYLRPVVEKIRAAGGGDEG